MEWLLLTLLLTWMLVGLVCGLLARATAKQMYNTGKAADDESDFWLGFSLILWPITLFAFKKQQDYEKTHN